MASHFVGLARGANGTQDDDFITGTSSNAAATLEMRIDDGAGYRTSELEAQWRALGKIIQEARLRVMFGVVVNG